MILPLRFILACAVLAAAEYALGPESPQHADAALPLFSLSVAIFLACYAVAIVCDWVVRRAAMKGRIRRAGIVAAVAGSVLRVRGLLPMLFWGVLVFQVRWDVWADYRFSDYGLTISSFMMLAPFFVYEGLAVLGEILLIGRIGRAGDHLRSTLFVAPMLFFLTGLFDLLGQFDATRAAVQELGIVRNAVWTLGFVALFALFPIWFAWLFGARRLLPDSLREDFEKIAETSRVRVHRILELPTRGRALNATLVGPFRSTRSVFFTDLILARFGIPELRAVFAHELGHARGHHVLRSVAFFVILPLLAAELLASCFTVRSEWVWSACVAGCFLLIAVPFFWFRRRFEHEADLQGAKTLGSTEGMIGALRAVEQLVPRASRRGSLMHPSTTKRIELLELAESTPQRVASWARTTSVAQAILFFALGVVVTLFVPRAYAELQRDLPGYMLATGRMEDAIEGFENAPEMAEGRRARGLDEARRALLISYDDADVEALRRRAIARGRRALRSEDWTAVRGWFGLAGRLGTDDLLVSAIWRYLDAERRGDEYAKLRESNWIRSYEVPSTLRRAIANMLSGSRQ